MKIEFSWDRVILHKEYSDFPHFCTYEIKSIFDCLDSSESVRDEKVLAYLKGGTLVAGSPGLEEDPIDPSKWITGGFSEYTDGYWTWCRYLTYFYENYPFKLPPEFLDHIKRNNYIPPTFSIEQRKEITELHRKLYDQPFR